jgi:hypothetical protein
MNEPQDWDEGMFGSLDMNAVRERHQPDYKFRVQQRTAKPHTQFPSLYNVTQATYVISGSIEIASGDGSGARTIHANQFIELPSGRYLITYKEAVEFVFVLELPPQVWKMG